MTDKKFTKKELEQRNAELQFRLEEAEETLRAIREGEVDALVVSGPRGDQVFSLFGTESVYRLIVETMKEAAFTVALNGNILYCNDQFCQLVMRSSDQIIGHPLDEFVANDNNNFTSFLLIEAQKAPVRRRLVFRAEDGTAIPAHVSAHLLIQPNETTICVVASDLTELENSTELIQKLQKQQEALQAANEELMATEEELRAQTDELLNSQNALRESESKFRSLFDNSLDAVFLTIPNGSIVAANPAACDMFGWTEQEFRKIGRSGIIYLGGPGLSAALAERQRTGRVRAHELTGIRKSGEKFPIEVDSVLLEGMPPRSFVIMRDISHRKQAEAELRDSEARLRLALDSGQMGLWDWDVQANRSVWNAKEYELLGLPVGNGREPTDRFFQAVHPDDLPALNESLSRAMSAENDWKYECRIIRPDGQIRWVAAVGRVFRDDSGFVKKMIGVNYDITERKRAEEALHQFNAELEQRVAERTAELAKAGEKVSAERQRFLDVLETLPVIVTLTRPDYRLEFVNKAYRDALGDNVGRLCYESQFGFEKPCDECQAFIPLSTGQPHHWEWKLPNGRIFEIHNFPFADSDGSPMILEMDIDVTDRRQAERELRQAHGDLEARAAQLRTLAAELTLTEQQERKRLAMVLHDGLQQMLVAAKFRLALMERSRDIAQDTANVANLIDDCIQTSRSLTAELSPPILHQGGLIPALEWLVQWMRDRHGLAVELHSRGQITLMPEDITVLLFQAVRELLFNVAKHAGTRQARIGVARLDGHIELIVADEGVGFDPAQLSSRSDSAETGMGLFSIRERLGYIGGTMEIDSALG